MDLVREDDAFVVIRGVGHSVPAGALLLDENTGDTVAYVAYNLKDMDPTELRAIALPLPGAAGVLEQGRALRLAEDGVVARAPSPDQAFGVGVGPSPSDAEGLPLFNDYPGVDDRQPISENFRTGVKAVDAIVPVGVGQSMLLMGKSGSRKTTLALDVLLAHASNEVEGGFKFVYACDTKDLARVREAVSAAGLESRTAIVTSDAARDSPGERYACVLRALAIAEGMRDAGGDAVVFLDDLSGPVEFWEAVCRCESEITGGQDGMEEMVEVDGMLIARFDALQRQFFSNILQRSARMNDKLGGGSLTLFGLLRGEPKREDKMDLGVKILKQQNLSAEMREKLLRALAEQVKDSSHSSNSDGGEDSSGRGDRFHVSTRTVEEFKSISDGHILLCDSNIGRGEDTYDIVPSLSTTRLGVGRVAAPEVADLCSSLQLELQQSLDASAFGAGAKASAKSVLALFTQRAGRPVPLAELREDLARALLEKKEKEFV